jgi:lipoyl(octanoyl) transferase
MTQTPASAGTADAVLQVYLLGTVDFEAMLRAQRHLVYDVAGDRGRAVLILCEHTPIISVGREGSREHIRCSPAELAARRWPVRWVNRGGDCVLHLPGQLAVYPIFPLDRLGLGLQAYLDHLHAALTDVLAEFDLPGVVLPGRAGVWIGGRRVAHVGVAVRDWVTYYGAALNVNPDLDLLKRVAGGPAGEPPMTSIERERRAPVRPAAVRQRVVEAFRAEFGFGRLSLFQSLPELARQTRADAVAPRSA